MPNGGSIASKQVIHAQALRVHRTAVTPTPNDTHDPHILPVMGGWGRVLCDGAARPLLMDRSFHPWSVMAERMRVMNVSE